MGTSGLMLPCFYFIDGPSSTIGSCIMSALSIPPSQKTNITIGLESIHNYANVLNPISFVGGDQYNIVTIYTEVEVGASEVDGEMIEAAEAQDQTDFYEEEIVAERVENAVTAESPSSRVEEASEAVDIAKALETLTKTFALRKEALGQDVSTETIDDTESSLNDEVGTGNATDEGITHETHGASEQTRRGENRVEEVKEPAKVILQPEGIESNMTSDPCTESKDANECSSVGEEFTDASSEAPNSETQQSACLANVRRSCRLQTKTSPSWQQAFQKFKRSSKETNGEPKMYRSYLYCK